MTLPNSMPCSALDDFFPRSVQLANHDIPEIQDLDVALRSALCKSLGGRLKADHPTSIADDSVVIQSVLALTNPNGTVGDDSATHLQYVMNVDATLSQHSFCELLVRVVPLTATGPSVHGVTFNSLWFQLPLAHRRVLVRIFGTEYAF